MTTPEPAAEPAGMGARQRLSRRVWSYARPAALGLLGTLVGVYLFTRLDDDPAPAQPADVGLAIATAFAEFERRPAASAELYQVILPSLVYITTGEDGESGTLGAGVVINEDGSILTALHVVADSQVVYVVFADGTKTVAHITMAEPESDLAILEAETLPEVVVPAILASGSVRVGDEAFAAGNPLGLVGSLSAGVISGLDREISLPSGDKLGGLLQFDAAVNPGSSGGPLLNREGQVIGIVTALANPSRDGSFLGIGFASPLSSGGAGGGPPR